MPRVSAAYKLGEKTVAKFGYGMFYDTLNAADYTANNLGYNATTTNTNSTDFGQTFGVSLADPFPVRAGRPTIPPASQRYARRGHRQPAWRSRRRTRITSTRGCSGGASGFSGKSAETSRSRSPTTGRTRIVARSASGRTICPSRYWITGNVRNNTAQAALVANVANPYSIANFAGAADDQPRSCISGWRRTRSSPRRPRRRIACSGRSRRSTTAWTRTTTCRSARTRGGRFRFS